MVKIFLIGHDYEYEVKELLKLFYNVDELTVYSNYCDIHIEIESFTEDIIINRLIKDKNQIIVITEAQIYRWRNTNYTQYTPI